MCCPDLVGASLAGVPPSWPGQGGTQGGHPWLGYPSSWPGCWRGRTLGRCPPGWGTPRGWTWLGYPPPPPTGIGWQTEWNYNLPSRFRPQMSLRAPDVFLKFNAKKSTPPLSICTSSAFDYMYIFEWLPTTYVIRGKVIFSYVSVILSTEGRGGRPIPPLHHHTSQKDQSGRIRGN